MKIDDILDLTLREILDTYCIVYSPECDYIYGFSDYETMEKLYENYNIDVYAEAFEPDSMIPAYILTDYHEEFLQYKDLENIMKNLDIPKRELKK